MTFQMRLLFICQKDCAILKMPLTRSLASVVRSEVSWPWIDIT